MLGSLYLLKVEVSISVIDDGISIFVKEKNLLKAVFPIFVTDNGISICFNDMQPSKAPSQMF